MGGTETIYEQMTKRLFRRNYLGCVVDRDVAGAQATRDFDVVRLGKVRHAVEVTSSQIEEGRRARDDWDKLRNTDLGLGVAWSLSAHEERRGWAFGDIQLNQPHAELAYVAAHGFQQGEQ